MSPSSSSGAQRPDLAVTWWGHASATVDAGGVRIAIDPLLSDRLLHLVRHGPTPPATALDADAVLVSHLHADHCHLPSLARFAADVPIIVPRGADGLFARLGAHRVIPVAPGDVVAVGPGGRARVEVLPATHDGHRLPFSRDSAVALGFRVEVQGAGSWWFPGDTELRADMTGIAPVDLALVPIGGWGPSLGAGHMGPEDAAEAVVRVGATYAVPVHWGTFWPVGLQRLARENHHRLFTTPGERFTAAMAPTSADALVAVPGTRIVL